VEQPPSGKPLLIYDGDCHFCMHWIRRWQKATGANVDYNSFQEAGARFPEIPRAAYESAVQWIEPDGLHLSGADAVFRLLDFTSAPHPLLQRLRCVPGFMPLARIGYRIVAGHRTFFSLLTRLFTRA